MAATMPEEGLGENVQPSSHGDGTGQALVENEEIDNGVTEIESLCMNCHSNVRIINNPIVVDSDQLVGYHEAQNPSYTLFSRSFTRVILLRKLRP